MGTEGVERELGGLGERNEVIAKSGLRGDARVRVSRCGRPFGIALIV